MKYLIFATLAAGLSSFLLFANNDKKEIIASTPFQKYWYDGKAELNSYDLEQNRYGEIHKGESVLIFVTEDFSKSKQVKLDNVSTAGKDASPILKMNATKQFLTGIYPYTIMNSVFTPVDLSGSLKTACSVQEWCGHTFMQLNKTDKGYSTKEFSYFESEGDKSSNLPAVLLEDELWNILRIDPNKIPKGKIKLIRGNQAVRLMHKPSEAVDAVIVMVSGVMDDMYPSEQVAIKMEDRQLVIHYEKKHPYKILGWDETYSEFKGKELTTRARLKKSIRLPYWMLHNNEHRIYRDSLKLQLR